jgi:hypothetical protein
MRRARHSVPPTKTSLTPFVRRHDHAALPAPLIVGLNALTASGASVPFCIP